MNHHPRLHLYFCDTMPSKLEEILAATRARVAAAKSSADLRALEEAAERHRLEGVSPELCGGPRGRASR